MDATAPMRRCCSIWRKTEPDQGLIDGPDQFILQTSGPQALASCLIKVPLFSSSKA